MDSLGANVSSDGETDAEVRGGIVKKLPEGPRATSTALPPDRSKVDRQAKLRRLKRMNVRRASERRTQRDQSADTKEHEALLEDIVRWLGPRAKQKAAFLWANFDLQFPTDDNVVELLELDDPDALRGYKTTLRADLIEFAQLHKQGQKWRCEYPLGLDVLTFSLTGSAIEAFWHAHLASGVDIPIVCTDFRFFEGMHNVQFTPIIYRYANPAGREQAASESEVHKYISTQELEASDALINWLRSRGRSGVFRMASKPGQNDRLAQSAPVILGNHQTNRYVQAIFLTQDALDEPPLENWDARLRANRADAFEVWSGRHGRHGLILLKVTDAERQRLAANGFHDLHRTEGAWHTGISNDWQLSHIPAVDRGFVVVRRESRRGVVQRPMTCITSVNSESLRVVAEALVDDAWMTRLFADAGLSPSDTLESFSWLLFVNKGFITLIAARPYPLFD